MDYDVDTTERVGEIRPNVCVFCATVTTRAYTRSCDTSIFSHSSGIALTRRSRVRPSRWLEREDDRESVPVHCRLNKTSGSQTLKSVQE